MRYIVLKPRGTDEWWNVKDTTDPDGPYMASFFVRMPNVEKEANDLCDRLNGTK